MADYVLLFSGGRMPESEDGQAAVMKAWTSCPVLRGGAEISVYETFQVM
jgi:hypothetical protein